MPDEGMAMRFHVTIDGLGDLGDWTKCSGLAVEIELIDHIEGGQNNYIHRLPGRTKYGNVTLSRPLNSDSPDVGAWITSMQLTVKRQTAEIAVFDSAGKKVTQWNLIGVIPVKWTGPTLDTNGNYAAVETVEFSHQGFMGGGDAGAAAAGALTAIGA